MYCISWFFLKMAEKTDRGTSLLVLPMAGIPLLFAAFLVFMAGAATILCAWPAPAPMLLAFCLPFALRKEKTRSILSGRGPLTVAFRPVVRNWVYAVYAVLPALPLLFFGWKIPLSDQGNGRALAEFFLMWMSLYSIFMVLTVLLGKTAYLKLGRLLLAAAVNLALILFYSLVA